MSDDKICPRCHQSTEPGWIDERVPKLEARVRELEAENLGDVQAWEQHSRELHQQIHCLEAELEQWSKRGIVEIAVRNPSVMEYIKHWEGRAERAEAEIERLRELLREARDFVPVRRVVFGSPITDLRERIDAALKESRT